MVTVEGAFGLFSTAGGAVAVPAESLVQVLENGLRLRLPGAPELVQGVVEFDGRLIPLLDLQLQAETAGAFETQPLVVICMTQRGPAGFAVRQVRQVAPVSAGHFETVDPDGDRPWWTGTFEFRNEHFKVIDVDRLVEVLAR